MKGIRSLLLCTGLLIAASASGKDAASDQGLGMVASQLTGDEMAAPVNFELVLGIYPFDLLKRQATEATMSMLDVKGSYGEIVSWLKRSGLTVTATDPSCVVIELQGTRKQLNTVLHTDFVREAEGDRSVIVPVTGSSLPYRPMGSVLTIQDLILKQRVEAALPASSADGRDSSGPAPLLLETEPGV